MPRNCYLRAMGGLLSLLSFTSIFFMNRQVLSYDSRSILNGILTGFASFIKQNASPRIHCLQCLEFDGIPHQVFERNYGKAIFCLNFKEFRLFNVSAVKLLQFLHLI